MKLRLRIPVLLACILSISCGVDEYYYLPQVPEINIKASIWEAEIRIPPISTADFYYAYGYTIFYRIYPSEVPTLATITQNGMPAISSSLASDYLSLFNAIDPTNTTTVPTPSTFTERNYFEIEFEGADVRSKLSTAGGTLRISFPPTVGVPVANINGEQFNLSRASIRLTSPVPDLYFRNTSELRDRANATSIANADVAVHIGSPQYTYVSMYIAAIGTNQTNFNQILSKPTHISVFRLTDFN